MNRGRILVVRGGAIGDFILTLPALAALRRHFPQTRVEVLGYPHIAGLATLADLAHDVRSINAKPLAGFFARGGVLDAALGDYFAGFNIIVSYLYDPDEIFRTNVSRCSKAQFIPCAHRPVESEGIHATEVFLRGLERLAIFEADSVPRLRIPASVPATPQSRPGLLAVHPGSGSEKKNWPEENWVELLQHIVRETDWRLLLVGGEAEESRLQRLATLIPVQRLVTAINRPLPELAQRLGSGTAFLGHDSGITHLAAAVGLPGIAMWGESSEQIWRPRSEHIQVLRHAGGLSALPVHDVFGRLHSLLDRK